MQILLSIVMARNMNISFLGTSSGGGPSISRNCSSLGMVFPTCDISCRSDRGDHLHQYLVADVIGDGSLWSALVFLNT